MEKILQIKENGLVLTLQEDKVICQTQYHILIINLSTFQYFEYPLINISGTKVVCDNNLTNQLIFDEKSAQTYLYQINLEKSTTPVFKVVIELSGISLIKWFNTSLCFFIVQNYLIMYDLQTKSVTSKQQLQIRDIIDIKVDPKFEFLLFVHKTIKGINCFTLIDKDNFENIEQFENSGGDFIEFKKETSLAILQKKQNQIFINIVIFDDHQFIKKEEIKQNLILKDLRNIVEIKYLKQNEQSNFLLMDSQQNLYVMAIDNNFQLTQKQIIKDVFQYGFTLPKNNLIILNKQNEILIDKASIKLTKPNFEKQILSTDSVTKIRQLHGLRFSNSSESINQMKTNYEQDIQRFQPQFSRLFEQKEQLNFTQAEYRIINDLDDQKNEMQSMIPQMIGYIETDTVQQYLNYFELILKSEQPIICEGDAASGKTSIIQYLAFIKKQPLLIMNLNSNTQIDDFTGKVQILPGFQFSFQLGPFAQAVQNGYWILLDEANLASDSILRVIEDVLEQGYFSIYGSKINSHPDAVDGVLTIRRHQNFRLFLTQNPSTSEQFAGTRNEMSKSFLSQFLLFKFPSMTESQIKQIILRLIENSLTNVKEKEKLCDLILRIYILIKKDNQDNGLFTLRDILQLLDLLALEKNYNNVLGLEVLPMQFCIEQIFTQFCVTAEIEHKVEQAIKQFAKFGYSNHDFELQLQENTNKMIQWSFNQNIMFLTCYNFLLEFLSLCYRTKRPALIIGQQYCGKLTSIKFWLRLQGIKNYYVLELSSNTTYEDLFGKYQSKNSGFELIQGPVVKCFSEGGVLILKNLEAPESSLTEGLNSILEKKCQTLLANNKTYIRHKDFFIIGVSSDENELAKKFTPALKSRFLQLKWNYEITLIDLKNILLLLKLDLKESIIDKIFTSAGFENQKSVSSNKIIRVIRPINQFYQFYVGYLKKQPCSTIQRIEDNIDYFIKMSEQSKKINSEIQVPLNFEDISSQNKYANQFVFTESRRLISDILAMSVACKQSLILQGSAGVGKTKIISIIQEQCQYFEGTQFYYINMNQNTELNDLMGSYVSSQKEKNKFEFKKGPLLLGMEEGGIVLVDEVNLVEKSIMNFLASIIKYPKIFFDPVSNEWIQIHEKFRLFFAQNPPSYVGRQEITESLASKSSIVEVPNYTFKEVLSITSNMSESISNGMIFFLEDLIQYPENGEESKKSGIQFTLRQFLKFRNRLIKTNFSIQQENWKDIIKLHQIILYPFSDLESKSIQGKILKINSCWIFEIYNYQSSIKCEFTSKGQNDELIQIVDSLSEQAKLTLCKIALSYFCRENILLTGPTTYKTFLLRLFSKLIKFKSNIDLCIIYVSNVTELNELVGSVESHNIDSYRKYSINIINRLTDRPNNSDSSVEDVIKQLSALQKLEGHNHNFFSEMIENMNNQFPFVERGITLNVRFGGIIYLKNINLADQSVIEGLNSLLELEPQYYVNGKKIKLNDEFFFAASVNTNSGGQLSDALLSRLTIITINEEGLLDGKNELNISFQANLKKLIGKQSVNSELIFLLHQILSELKHQNINDYAMLTYRHFYQLCKILQYQDEKQDILPQPLEKFLLGAQSILLGPLQKDIEVLLKKQRTKEMMQATRYVQGLIDKKFLKSRTLILNEITNSIIKDILIAQMTQSIVCLIGPPGVGKSAIAKEMAQAFNKNYCRICCSDNLSVEDLFGSYAPSQQQGGTFLFQEGYLAKALQKKSVILFDEINLASPDVLSTLQQLFDQDEQFMQVKDSLIDKTGNIFICCMNPPEYQGRNELPYCISSLITKCYIKQFSIDQVLEIFQDKFQKEILKLKRQGIQFGMILELHKDLALNHSKESSTELQYDFNIRFLQNLISMLNDNFIEWKKNLSNELQKELMIVCLEIIYVDHFQEKQIQKIIQDKILKVFQMNPQTWKERQLYLTQFGPQIVLQIIVNQDLKPYLTLNKINQISPQYPNNNYIITNKNSQIFEKLFLAISSRKIILLQGDVATGKTATILKFAQLLNQRVIFLPIYSELEADDLLGNFSIINQQDEELQQYLHFLNNQKYEKVQAVMKYIDGVLKICMQFGYWLILDNVNLAKSEILERLNSLGEEEPELFINEFGDEKINIRPHKNFRLICTQNPNKRTEDQFNKSLSHAFYNRCLKINFSYDLQADSKDLIEMMTRQNPQTQYFSQDAVLSASKLLHQIQYISKKEKLEVNIREIQKTFRMMTENNFETYKDTMIMMFGEAFRNNYECSDFPIFDFGKLMKSDKILKNLIVNTINLEEKKFDTITSMKIESLQQFLLKYIRPEALKKYEYFVNSICERFLIKDLKECFTNSEFGTYDFQLKGSFKINCFEGEIEIAPKNVSIQIQDRRLIKFYMRSDFNFLNKNFSAEIVFNKSQNFELKFENNDLKDSNLFKFVSSNSNQFSQIFPGLLENTKISAQLLLQPEPEFKFNLKVEQFSIAYFPICQFQKIQVQIFLNKKRQQFIVDGQIFVSGINIAEFVKLSSTSGVVNIKTDQIIVLLTKLSKSCGQVLEKIKLQQSKSKQSTLDLSEKKLTLELISETLFEIFCKFQIQINQISIDVSHEKQYCEMFVIFYLSKRAFCNLRCTLDSQAENKFKLVLAKQEGVNLMETLKNFFRELFEGNQFLDSFQQATQCKLLSGDVILNEDLQKINFELQFDWKISICQNIQFDIVSMLLNYERTKENIFFELNFGINLLKLQMLIKLEIDLQNLLGNKKSRSIRLSLQKIKQVPLKEIIAEFSPELNSILSQQQSYEEMSVDFDPEQKSKLDITNDSETKNKPQDTNNIECTDVTEIAEVAENPKCEMIVENPFENQNAQVIDESANAVNIAQSVENLNNLDSQTVENSLVQKKEENDQTQIIKQENIDDDDQHFIEWKEGECKFQLKANLISNWKILGFVTLSDCYISIKGSTQIFSISLIGFITILNVKLPQFILEFNQAENKKRQLIIKTKENSKCEIKDPIDFGLDLLGQKTIQKLGLFPKITHIEKFEYNIESQILEACFKTDNAHNYTLMKILTFNSIVLRIDYQRNRDFNINLKTQVAISTLQIDLNLDFAYLRKQLTDENQSNNVTLKLASETIKNFQLNQFLFDVFKISLPSQIGILKFEEIKFNIEMNRIDGAWKKIFEFDLVEGDWTFYEKISLSNLKGKLFYSTEKKWDGSKIKGNVKLKKKDIGTFNIDLSSTNDEGKTIALEMNDKFIVADLTEEIVGTKSKVQFPFKIKLAKLDFLLKPNKTIFMESRIKFHHFEFFQNALKFDDLNLHTEMTIGNVTLGVKCELSFKLIIFELIQAECKYNYPNKELKLEIKSKFLFQKLCQIILKYSNIEVPDVEFLRDASIDLTSDIILNAEQQFKLTKFVFIGKFKAELPKDDTSVIFFQSVNIEWNLQQNKHILKIDGDLLILGCYKFQFIFDNKDKYFQFKAVEQQEQKLLQFVDVLNEQGTLSEIFPKFNENFTFQELKIDWSKKLIEFHIQIAQQIFSIYINYSEKYLMVCCNYSLDFNSICECLKPLDDIFQKPEGQFIIHIQKPNKEVQSQFEFLPDQFKELIGKYKSAQQIEVLKNPFFSTSLTLQLQGNFWHSLYINNSCQIDFSLNIVCLDKIALKSDIFNGEDDAKQVTSEYYFKGIWHHKKKKMTLDLVALFQLQEYDLKINGTIQFEKSKGKKSIELKGTLNFTYNNAFGLKNLNLIGNICLEYGKNGLLLSAYSKICYNKIEVALIIIFKSFIPEGFGIKLKNINFKDALQYFQLEDGFDKSFFDFLPQIEQFSMSIGELDNKSKSELFPEGDQEQEGYFKETLKGIQQKVCDVVKKGFKKFSKFSHVCFYLNAKAENNFYFFNIFLDLDKVNLNMKTKGSFQLEYQTKFFLSFQFNGQSSLGKIEFGFDGTLRLWEKHTINIKGSFGLGKFYLKALIELGSPESFQFKFNSEFQCQLKDNPNLKGDLQLVVNDNEQLTKKKHFQLLQIKFFKVNLLITITKLTAKLEYDFDFLNIKFCKTMEIEFQYEYVVEKIKQIFKGLFDLLNLFEETQNQDLENAIKSKQKEIEKISKENFETDVIYSKDAKEVEEKNKKMEDDKKEKEKKEENKKQEEALEEKAQEPEENHQQLQNQEEKETTQKSDKKNNNENPPNQKPQKEAPKNNNGIKEDQEQQYEKQTLDQQNLLRSLDSTQQSSQNEQTSEIKSEDIIEQHCQQNSQVNEQQQHNRDNQSTDQVQQSGKIEEKQIFNLELPQKQKDQSPTSKSTTTEKKQQQKEELQKQQDNNDSNKDANQTISQEASKISEIENSLQTNNVNQREKSQNLNNFIGQEDDLKEQENNRQVNQSGSGQSKDEYEKLNQEIINKQINTQIEIETKPQQVVQQKQPYEQQNSQQKRNNETNQFQITDQFHQENQPLRQSTKTQGSDMLKTTEGKDESQRQKQIQSSKQSFKSQQSQEGTSEEVQKQSIFPNMTKNKKVNDNIEQRENEPTIYKINFVQSKQEQHQLQLSNFIIPIISIEYPKKKKKGEAEKHQNVEKQENQITNIQKQLELNYDLKSDYDILSKQISQKLTELHLETKSDLSINSLDMRVILMHSDKACESNWLYNIGTFLIGLASLKIQFDVIISGKIQPLLLKKSDTLLTYHILDKIFHYLNLRQIQNLEEAPRLKNQNIMFVMNQSNEILQVTQNCREQLQQSRINSIYFYCSQNIIEIDLNNQQKLHSQNFLQLLMEHMERLQGLQWNQQEINYHQIDEQFDIEKIHFHNAVERRRARNLGQKLKVSRFTKYSLSSKGTIIDIKGILKFYTSNGTCKDIMKKKDKGGKHFYVIQIILDILQLNSDTINNLLIPFLLFLIEICKELKIICNLILFQGQNCIKDNYSYIWTKQEVQDLLYKLQQIYEFQNQAFNIQILENCFSQLSKFNQYQKYLVFVNHSFFNYPYLQLSQLFAHFTNQGVKIVNLDIPNYFHSFCRMKNLYHYTLEDMTQFSGIIEKILFDQSMSQDQVTAQQFIFIKNEDTYKDMVKVKEFSDIFSNADNDEGNKSDVANENDDSDNGFTYSQVEVNGNPYIFRKQIQQSSSHQNQNDDSENDDSENDDSENDDSENDKNDTNQTEQSLGYVNQFLNFSFKSSKRHRDVNSSKGSMKLNLTGFLSLRNLQEKKIEHLKKQIELLKKQNEILQRLKELNKKQYI